MTRHFRHLKSATLAAAIIFAGCGKSEGPPLARVTGVITIEGQPLKSGNVQFIPDTSQGTTGRMAVGAIDAEGRYVLTTRHPGDGAQIGHHIVLVQAYEDVPAPPGGPAPYISKPLIPEAYSDPAKSQLRAEVKKNQDNDISFELSRKP